MKQSTPNHKRFVAEKRSMATWKLGSFERSARQTTFVILVCGVFLSGCSGGFGKDVEPMTPAAEVFTFKQYEIVTGIAKHQTVLTGFLLDGPLADLAVVHSDANAVLRLRIYAFGDGTWAPKLEATLSPEVLFADIANIGGRDRLITYARGHLHWFDTESAMEHVLVAVSSNFELPRSGDMPHVDITRDVNGDARDDLVVPDADGFWVFIQMRDGTFAAPVKLGRAPDMAWCLGVDGYRYAPWSESRIHEMDYNRDGRPDLVFWNDDHFVVHLQNAQGLFASVATTFTTDVAFDSDRLSLLATGDMTGKVLHSLADVNGDGVDDLVVFELSGRDISSKHSSYEVHFGAPTPDGGTVFARGIDIAFQSDEKIQLGMARHDFDRDGQIDLMITTIDLKFLEGSLWKSIKGFMGDDIWLGLEFYQMEEGCYPGTPNTIRRIALDGVPSHREPGWVPLDIVLRGGTHGHRNTQKCYSRAFNTTLLIGDVTGDGRSDLLIGDHPRIMAVFVGVPGPEMFSRRSQEVAVAFPNDEEYTWLVDLNKDGVQDVLMHHPFTLRDAHGAPIQPLGTEPHRVVLLIAR